VDLAILQSHFFCQSRAQLARLPSPADFPTAFPKLLPSRRGYSKIARFASKFAQFGALDINVGRAVHVLGLRIVPRWWGMKIAGLRHGVAMEVVTTQRTPRSPKTFMYT
jgi:hypothetical protein